MECVWKLGKMVYSWRPLKRHEVNDNAQIRWIHAIAILLSMAWSSMAWSSLAVAQVTDRPETHVVLIVGQSNAVGNDEIENSTLKSGYPEGVMQLGRWFGKDMELIPAQYPLDHHSRRNGRFGPALQFSIDYSYARPDVRLVLVPCGRGGTGFSSGQWGIGSFLSNDAIRRVNYLLQSEDNAELVAIIWAQGERDARDPATSRAEYEKALDAQLIGFRKYIDGGSIVPILIGQMVPEFARRRDLHGIQDVINGTPKRIPNTHIISGAGVESEGKNTPNDRRDDEIVHYSSNGNRTMGGRYAAKLLELQTP